MADEKVFRNLSAAEILLLEDNGCRSNEWNRVKVSAGFTAGSFRNVVFSGDVRLGKTGGVREERSGITLHEGIVDARIHNCDIGNSVVIRNISGYIANYVIGYRFSSHLKEREHK